MRNYYIPFLAISLAVCCIVTSGCKAKKEEPRATEEEISMGETSVAPVTEEATQAQVQGMDEANMVETIPPTAAPQVPEKPKASVATEKVSREKEIQRALKNAGFYTGAIDGKIGPNTKKAIQEFQKSKGLTADGKVGSRTWAALEKYLGQ